MRVFLASLYLDWHFSTFVPVLKAQILQTYVPLQLQGEPRPTQVPPYSTVTSPQCDESGQVYLNYSSQTDTSRPATLAAIEADGTTQTVNFQSESESSSDRHVFLYSAANDGSLHQIVRVPDSSDREQLGDTGRIRHLRFRRLVALRKQLRATIYSVSPGSAARRKLLRVRRDAE